MRVIALEIALNNYVVVVLVLLVVALVVWLSMTSFSFTTSTYGVPSAIVCRGTRQF